MPIVPMFVQLKIYDIVQYQEQPFPTSSLLDPRSPCLVPSSRL